MISTHTRPSEHLKERIESDLKLRIILEYSCKNSGSDPAHDISHFFRVAKMTLTLGIDYQIDWRSCVAAALLHDIVSFKKDDPKNKQSSQLSARAAKDLLSEIEFASTAEIDEICLAIETHSFSKGLVPSSNLGKCLQDADRLDALGAVGLFRLFSVGTQMGSKLYDPIDPWAIHRSLDDKQFIFDHLQVKLFKLPEQMQTEIGKQEAERRVIWMQQFLKQFALEGQLEAPVAQRITSIY